MQDGGGVEEGELLFGFGDDDVEGQFDDFINVEEFALLKVQHQESFVGEQGEAFLFFLGYAVVIGLILDVFLYYGGSEFLLCVCSLHLSLI